MDDYKRPSAQCKDDILEDKQKWTDNLATEAEVALNNGQVKDAFANLRRLRSACPRIFSPIFLSDGTVHWCLISHRSYNVGETTTPNYSVAPMHLRLLNYKTQLLVQFRMT